MPDAFDERGLPVVHLARVIEYDVPDRDGNGTGELIVLLTTILDLGGDDGARADELAAAYHQRWEQETANDQLKTHLRGPGRVLRHSWRPRSQPDALGSSILVVTVCREDLDQRADQREVLVLGVVRIRPEGRDGQVGHVPIVAGMASALSTSSTKQARVGRVQPHERPPSPSHASRAEGRRWAGGVTPHRRRLGALAQPPQGERLR